MSLVRWGVGGEGGMSVIGWKDASAHTYTHTQARTPMCFTHLLNKYLFFRTRR